MVLSTHFKNDLGEALKDGKYRDFELKWAHIIDGLEHDAAPRVKTSLTPWYCPICRYKLR